MKKVLLILMCLVSMMVASTGMKAQEVTIIITPGWNWISCPMMDTLDFATAMGSFTPQQGDIIKSRNGFSEYYNNEWFGNLQHFYPGVGYMYKSNRTESVTLTFTAQQPVPQVVVTTSEPMLVTAISAMSGGEVTVNDGTYILMKGLCWATHENPTTNDDFYQEAESGVGSFTLSMNSLNISTTYYVRAYAVTANGTFYGDQKTFTTRDGISTLTTAEVTDITGATATCGGNITDNGGLNVTARGVCWSTSPNPTVADSHTTNGNGSGTFSSSITGLSVSTTYYVRAYSTTAAGTSYGENKTFTTRDGIPTLTTADVTNITSTTATCGGDITDNGGLDITARGVCWSTSSNPTISNSHTTNGSGTGSFVSNLTGLSPTTTYYVRAYATNSYGTVYGNQRSFTTGQLPTYTVTVSSTPTGGGTATGGGTYNQGQSCTVHATANTGYTFSKWTVNGSTVSTNANYSFTVTGNINLVANFTSNSSGGHAYVDLGLPSGLLWATCNVGATTATGYGNYYAWGETQSKSTYSWSTYQYCHGSNNTLTKYCNNSSYGYNGFMDNLTTLLAEDDVATASWGSGWRMPTKEEWQELYQNTTHQWTTQNGVSGRLFTASNGNSIFIPAAGYRDGSSLKNAGSRCYYWSNLIDMDYPYRVWFFYAASSYCNMNYNGRNYGASVRPVRASTQN